MLPAAVPKGTTDVNVDATPRITHAPSRYEFDWDRYRGRENPASQVGRATARSMSVIAFLQQFCGLRGKLVGMRPYSKFVLLLFAFVMAGIHGVAQSSESASPVGSYPDNPAGLEHLFTDMLSPQRSGDSAALAPYLQSLVLPDPERWFTSKFGNVRCGEQQMGPNDCLGPRMAFTYRSLARVLPASFALTLTDFLQVGMADFEATNYTEECPGPQRIVAARELVGGLTTTPYLSSKLSGLAQHREPTYVVWAYNQHKETTLPFFVYFEGAFRYVGMVHPASVEDFQKTNAAGDAMRIAPSAHQLTEDQLEMKKVVIEPSLAQRTVVLLVSLSGDGKPKDVRYLRGPDAEKEAAIQSAMKRHFDRPGFGPEGFHPNLLCLNVAPSR